MSGIITIITCSVFVSFLTWKYEKNTEQQFKEMLDVKDNIERLAMDIDFVEAKVWDVLEQSRMEKRQLRGFVERVVEHKLKKISNI